MNELEIIEQMTMPDKCSQRQAIMALEEFAKTMPQVDVDVEQLLHGGCYVRAATAKAGTLLTGAIYKHDHIELMTKGVLITTCDDGKARKLEGFNLMPAPSGKKRAAYIIEDTTWITIHAVGETGSMEPQEVQDAITVETFEDLQAFYNEVNKADFEHMIGQFGMTKEQVDNQAYCLDDQTSDFNVIDYGLYLSESRIEGLGVFSDRVFIAGEKIMPARVKGLRTQAGRYINHAVRPNAQFVFDGDDVQCVAIDEIMPGDEITVNYRQVMQQRAAKGDLCQE